MSAKTKKASATAARKAGRRYIRKRALKSRVNTERSKALRLLQVGEPEELQAQLVKATSTIDKAASKGVFHPNKGARLKSRLMKQVNAARANSQN